MKKIFLVVLFLLTFSFFSCNKEEVKECEECKVNCDECKIECNNECNNEHEHKYSDFYSYDDRTHYHECIDKDNKIDVENHNFSDWLADYEKNEEVRFCYICGYRETRVLEKKEVEFEEEWSWNDSVHFHLALDGTEVKDYEEHSFGEWEERLSPTIYSYGVKVHKCKCGYEEEEIIEKLTIVKAPKLKKGDTIALIAPASATSDTSAINKAKNKLISYGFNVKVFNSVTNGSSYSVSYLALSDEVRAKEINDCFSDPTINGIVCMRGGYGSSRTLDLLDYKVIRENPKFFTGYSDITALVNAFYFKAGMISYQGFMGVSLASSSLDKTSEDDILDILFNDQFGKVLNYGTNINSSYSSSTGRLIGGNLTLVSHLLGSEYLPTTDSYILFLEDTGEALYSIDRMLTKLRIFHMLDNCKGLVFGYFTGNDKTQITNLIKREFAKLNIPVLVNFPSGHEYPFINLPIGANVEISNNGIKILEEIYS